MKDRKSDVLKSPAINSSTRNKTSIAQNHYEFYPQSVQLLAHGGQALAKYLQLINRAKESIDLTTWTLDPCSSSGRLILEALRRASLDRGVNIRVLIDAWAYNEDAQGKMSALLSSSKIAFRLFNLSYGPEKNVRLHSKVLIVDKKYLLAGGRNLADDYYGLEWNIQKNNWIDTDILIEDIEKTTAKETETKSLTETETETFRTFGTLRGNAALQATNYFNHYWKISQTTSAIVSEEAYKEYHDSCINIRDRELNILKELKAQLVQLDQAFPKQFCPKVSFISDLPGYYDLDGINNIGFNDQKHSSEFRLTNELSPAALNLKLSSQVWLDYLSKAKRNIFIENYSFVPGYHFKELFKNYKETKNIPIFYVTNGESDENLVAALSEQYVKEYHGGALQFAKFNKQTLDRENWFTKIYEQKDVPYIIHSKIFTIDNQTSLIGSFNIDPRSYHTNIESTSVVESCPQFAAQVETEIKIIFKAAIAAKSAEENLSPSQKEPSIGNFFEKLFYKIGGTLLEELI